MVRLTALGVLLVGPTACTDRLTSTAWGQPVVTHAGTIASADGARLVVFSETGRHYLARIEQLDVDLNLELRDASDRLLARSASPARGLGREYLLWRVTDAQPVNVVLRPAAPPARSARFRAEIFELPPSIDRRMLRALATLGQPKNDSPNIASELQFAANLFHVRGARLLEAATALRLAAQHYWYAENWADALRAAHRAARLAAEQNDRLLEAAAKLMMAASELEMIQSGRAAAQRFAAVQELLQDARGIFLQARLPVNAATVLIYDGVSRFYQSDFAGAVAVYERADAELAAVDSSAERSVALSNIAAVRLGRGEYRLAAEALEKTLPILKTGDPQLYSAALHN
ncbi:MAG: hypothetical protein NZM12_09970, partial [Steroidobacteraceae bacterium]|nr:hypothetical protein [Steroidobacteraceae bacterium]